VNSTLLDINTCCT